MKDLPGVWGGVKNYFHLLLYSVTQNGIVTSGQIPVPSVLPSGETATCPLETTWVDLRADLDAV